MKPITPVPEVPAFPTSPGDVITTSTTLFIYDDNGGCTDEATVTITISPGPDITGPTSLSGCGSVILPVITGTNLSGNEAYYTGTGGTGTSYVPGDVITTSTSLFIYDNNGGCTDEITVNITVTPDPDITGPTSLSGCGSVTLSVITGTNLSGNEAYYTGAGGTGTSYVPGDVITTSTSLFIYDNNGGCTDEITVNITVTPDPDITGPTSLSGCGSVTLPVITGTNLSGNEAYYTGAGGTGTSYVPGDVITTSTSLFIYDNNGGCTDEITVNITVTPDPDITGPTNLSGCGSVTLPVITGTNLSGNEAYYTGAGGTGTSYVPGDVITTSTSLFIYDNNGGCTDEIIVNITITPNPDITGPLIFEGCDEAILPPIQGTNLSGNETYYTGPNGTGTSYFPGDVIDNTITLFMFDNNNGCSDEEIVNIIVYIGPDITGPLSLEGCGSVTLPNITGTNLSGTETYYNASQGLGIPYFPGDVITVTQNLFIYDVDINNCSDEEIVSILIKPEPEITGPFVLDGCGQVELPVITGNNLSGNEAYYSGPGGTGTAYFPGEVITTSQNLYIYDDDGTNCIDEEVLSILIIPRPDITGPTSLSGCEFIELPNINGNDLTGNEAYYDLPGGAGTVYLPGDTIFSSTNLYIYDSDGSGCEDEEVLSILISEYPVLANPDTLNSCDSIVLPNINGTNLSGNQAFFTERNGTGTQYNFGESIDSSQLLYIFDQNGNCLAEDSIRLIVTPSPEFQTQLDTSVCGIYELPPILGNNLSGTQQYYTASRGLGQAYNSGDTLFTTTNLYVFDSIANCASEDTLIISITAPPSAGTDITTSVCQGNTIDLTTLLQGADNGGTFSDDDGTGALNGNNFNSTGITPGDYRFTYSLPAAGPCPGDQAVITISVVTAVSAGTNNQGNVCAGEIIDLITLLSGADAGGSFSDDDATGALNGNEFNTISVAPGSYRFTYTVGDGVICPQDQAQITVNVVHVPDPFAGNAIDACDFYILPTIIGNNLSGNEAYFTASQGGGISFTPGDTIFASTTLFLFDDNGTCSGEDELQVNITTTPNAGADNSASACQGSTVDLTTLLQGADNGGTFSDDDGTGALNGNNFNSTGITPGDYRFTYSLPAAGPCPGDQAVITISVVTAVSAGTNNQGNVCAGEIIDLITLLSGADAGGSFSDDDATGALNGNEFNTISVAPGSYRFTYTVGDGVICPQDQAQITVNVVPVPDPFAGNAIDACDFYILPTIIGNNLSGNEAYFTASQGGGISFTPGDTIFASITLFLFDDNGTCSEEDELQVNITTTPNAGADNSASACQGSTVDLTTLLQGADNGGTFSDDDGTGALNGNNFNSTGITPGDYRFTYSLPAEGPCPGDQAVITISVVTAVSAGTDNLGDVCAGKLLTSLLYFPAPMPGVLFPMMMRPEH